MIRTQCAFKLMGTLYAIFFVLVVADPIGTAAILPEVGAPVSVAEESAVKDTPEGTEPSGPHAYFLDETEAEMLPPDPVPLYDRYTVKERIDQRLPTVLPKTEPYYGEKVVYLTFDDGPDPENTPVILDILRRNNIKATFFMVGTEVEKSPSLVKQVFDAGHAVGNHSYDHVYRNLYKSVSSYTAELQHNDDLIKAAIGVRPRISRAPGGSAGSFTKEYWAALKRLGYIEMGWNISSGDASRAKAQDLVANVAYQLENKYLWSHAVVLMHDGRGHAETVKALPQIIQLFKDRGFEFRVVNAQTPPPW